MSFPKTPALMTDCAVFDPEGRILLVRRGSEPYKGCYALPGGFVEIGETVEAACRREIHEEAGVLVNDNLQLVGVYSDPNRDPRGHSVSVPYTTVLEHAVEPKSGSDAESAEWIEKWSNEPLAFNHAQIISDALRFNGGHGSFHVNWAALPVL
jgi:8-oxo-dGTP diphosphatase